ncbi:unnamed protein product [Rotaria sordida]|uniref:Regulator of chromosome condensation n=1 Tax=Rotaria sordida TaxID=392033 RepID=A0A813S617_9BILA|nr:unnamed protein product [Rotaria sordida]
MPYNGKSKAMSRSRTTKRQYENDDIIDDNNKENNDEKMTSTTKKTQEQQIVSNKKRTKQQSPAPASVKPKENTSKNNLKSSRSRSVAESLPINSLKNSNTTIINKKKKTTNTSSIDSKSKRQQSPSPSIESTNKVKNRATKDVLRITTTPITAKNIRHRSISSSSLTTDKNKKSILSTKVNTSKSRTIKPTDVQQSRSKSSMARSTRLMNTTRRTIRRQTTYLSVPSIINGNIKGGQVLAVGENGMTQLGLKSSIDQRKNPQPVLIPESIVQIAAGPLHSVCLTDQNNIYTFGCNDEYALGRPDNNNNDDDDDDDHNDTDPFGEVDLSQVMNIDEENIVQIVAGDSHTLVLSNMGKGKMAKRPIEILLPEKIVKLASGYDFILFLSETGQIYSCGNGETGQLGRLSRYASEDGRRGGIERLITPTPILYNRSSIKEKNLLFEDIFTGLSSTEPVFFPAHIPSLDGYQWKKFAGGLHHTLGLTVNGEVYAMGRCHEGQLGIDGLTTHIDRPILIPNIPKAVDIACGNHVSFIIDETGKVYSFGAGTSLQHGHGENDIKIPRIISSKFMDIKKIANIAVGAQHTIFLTKE